MKYCLILILFVAFQAQARDTFVVYLGAGGGLLQADRKDAYGQDVQFKYGEVMGGVRLKWVGVESRIGRGLMDEAIYEGQDPNTLRAITSKSTIDRFDSTYLRLQLENRVARIYALYGQTEMSATSVRPDGTSQDLSSKGDSYGIGAGIRLNKNMFFHVELRQLLKNDADNFWGVNFNIDISVLSL